MQVRIGRKSKIKSLTVDGLPAITRSFTYMEKDREDYVGIYISTLYMSETRQEDKLVRLWKDKLIYERVTAIKYDTFIKMIHELNIAKPAKKDGPSIDKVTVQNLELAFRMCNISASKDTVDLIIELVEIIEIKGDQATMRDILKIKEENDNR